MRQIPIKSTFPFLASYWLLFGLSLVPVWSVQLPPLQDYPNHLARIYILTNLHNSATLQTFYQTNWGFIPNLAMDVLGPVLTTLMPIEVAGKVFISLTFLLISSGVTALHYVLHRKLSP